MRRDDQIQFLREQGYRLTPQRLAILDVIQARGCHSTADEIYAEARRRDPAINRATVYRTLQWLETVGLLHKIDVGKDRLQYEFADAHRHHHLVCKTCGAEQEIDNHVVESMRAHILEHYSFEADPNHMAIFGRCRQCRTSDPSA